MTFDELVKRCKASVTLTVNGHRDMYETVDCYLWGEGSVPDSEMMEKFKAGADVYELHFYPETPVGSYRVFGTSLEDVLSQAESVWRTSNVDVV